MRVDRLVKHRSGPVGRVPIEPQTSPAPAVAGWPSSAWYPWVVRWLGGLLLIAACSAGDISGEVAETDAPVVGEGTGSAESATPVEDDDSSSAGTSTSTTDEGSSDVGDSSGTSSAPVCLDGSVDDGEQCDDGNDLNGDGCNRDCRLSGQLVWESSFGSGLGQVDQAYDVAPEVDGSVVVTGYLSANEEGARDGWMARYNSAGSLTWEVVLAGPGEANDEIRAVSSDNAGSVLSLIHI